MHVRSDIRNHFKAVCAALVGSSGAEIGRELVEDLDDESQNIWRVFTHTETSQKFDSMGEGPKTVERRLVVSCVVFVQDVDDESVEDRLDDNAALLETAVEDTPQELFVAVQLVESIVEVKTEETERLTGALECKFEVLYYTSSNDPTTPIGG